MVMITSMVKGKITINDLLAMARGMATVGRQLITDLDKDLEQKKIGGLNETSIILGKVTSVNILLSFASELGLTALSILDHPEKTKIPREHSLLFWWKKIKEETRNKICKRFEEIENKGKRTIKDVEALLNKNDQSHTNWRYWWRNGYVTRGTTPGLSMAIIDIGWSYSSDQKNRELQKGLDGHKKFSEARKR